MQSIGIKRRALCIGIEYWDHADVSEATGTHTDARRLATFLHGMNTFLFSRWSFEADRVDCPI